MMWRVAVFCFTIAIFACATLADTYPRLVKVGTTGFDNRISFQGVSLPDGTRNFTFTSNPVITGKNLYAPDLVRVGDGWHNYFGGWLHQSDVNDRIYLGRKNTLEPTAPWNIQLAINNGAYMHVNDPTVVRVDNQWHMLYTAAKFVGSDFRDWINWSTSSDGINWNPSAGATSTEIQMTDPLNIAGGVITDIARPSVVKTPTGWRMWFDARVDNGPLMSYLAESTSATPTSFSVAKRYNHIQNFPGLFEPDIVRRPDGTYVGVVQRHFRDLYLVTSTDGVNFTYSSQPVLSATEPFFGRSKVSNPGLMYDEIEDVILGLSFGMTNSDQLVDHDIGFSASQYRVMVRSPGNVWHGFSLADLLDQQSVIVFNYTDFDLVRITNTITGQIILEQSFTSAQVGDLWELQLAPPIPEPAALSAIAVVAVLSFRRRR